MRVFPPEKEAFGGKQKIWTDGNLKNGYIFLKTSALKGDRRSARNGRTTVYSYLKRSLKGKRIIRVR